MVLRLVWSRDGRGRTSYVRKIELDCFGNPASPKPDGVEAKEFEKRLNFGREEGPDLSRRDCFLIGQQRLGSRSRRNGNWSLGCAVVE